MRAILLPVLLGVASLLGGCHYGHRTAGADMTLFRPPTRTDDGRLVATPRPEARLPANLAIASVESSSRHGPHGWTAGYAMRAGDDVATGEDLDRIAAFTQVGDVTRINTLLVSPDARDGLALRNAAAALHADLLLVYTIDTRAEAEDGAILVTLLTLGVFPTKTARITTTASALMLDTRSGAVLAAAAHDDRASQLANAWTLDDAFDQSRRRAERRAFEAMLDDLERDWSRTAIALASNPPATVHPPVATPSRAEPARPQHALDGRRIPPGRPYRTDHDHR